MDTQPDDHEALARLLAGRHSCRAFRPEPVPEADIRRILTLAGAVPSWCNAQPWRATVTRGQATERLRAALLAHVDADGPAAPDFAFPRAYRGAYQERRRECAYQLYDAVGVARGDRAASARQTRENFRLFGAPHVCVVTSDEALGVYGAVDCGAFVTAFMLAARSVGAASIAQAALAAYAPLLRELLRIGEDRRVVCAISFGYEDEAHPANAFRTTRAPVEDFAEFQDE